MAARSLGDLVRKLGERILPEIIPILEAGLLHEDGDKRQGVWKFQISLNIMIKCMT